MSASFEQVRVRVLPDGRVSRSDAAAFLGLTPKTLADYKSRGIGPCPRKVGGRVFYRLIDLEAFRDTGAREA
ncbi:AlpA family transcriptional regulator [Novosphingobium sp. EMRT-2]|uniref:helix-turn-helix transcriptional regulator n=1 Tax=Novosphingobium sp. EMRT-2 TaxID=2571749 RepID=UPI0010BCF9B0|nr:DNA-binding protein [Novosphingobium sp. EMRT-2]QCI95552.1 DNA-binding protein [Novosphingobium sp. EMRT-2]